MNDNDIWNPKNDPLRQLSGRFLQISDSLMWVQTISSANIYLWSKTIFKMIEQKKRS